MMLEVLFAQELHPVNKETVDYKPCVSQEQTYGVDHPYQ